MRHLPGGRPQRISTEADTARRDEALTDVPVTLSDHERSRALPWRPRSPNRGTQYPESLGTPDPSAGGPDTYPEQSTAPVRSWANSETTVCAKPDGAQILRSVNGVTSKCKIRRVSRSRKIPDPGDGEKT